MASIHYEKGGRRIIFLGDEDEEERIHTKGKKGMNFKRAHHFALIIGF